MYTSSPYGAVVTHLIRNEKILSSILSAGSNVFSTDIFVKLQR